MEFNIGDIVIIKHPITILSRSHGNPTAWTKRKGNTAGAKGTIVDKMYSEAESRFLYRIRIEGENFTRAAFYSEDDIEINIGEIEAEYSVETEFLDNVVIAIVYKTVNGEKQEFVRGHGHIIHEGDVGVLQALSYALKKAYEKFNGGTL